MSYPDNWPRCPGCGEPALDGHITCGRAACDESAARRERRTFFHATPNPDACTHDFKGWVDLKNDEGQVCGGTTVCTKCGMDAISYSLRTGI